MDSLIKICPKCGTSKRGGVRNLCIQCVRDRSKKWRDSHKKERREYEIKYVTTNKDKINANARRCFAKNREKYLANDRKNYWKHPEKNREKSRRSMIKTNYGITWQEYDEMLKKQKGVCAVCKSKCPSGRRLAVDHDHKTGVIRGLLCAPCNASLGLLHESVKRCEALIKYIKEKNGIR